MLHNNHDGLVLCYIELRLMQGTETNSPCMNCEVHVSLFLFKRSGADSRYTIQIVITTASHLVCFLGFLLVVRVCHLFVCLCVLGAMSWIQSQIIRGIDPRSVLEELLPNVGQIPPNVNPITLWKVVCKFLL